MAATPCFFTRFAYFVDTKFSSVVFARSSLSFFFSLSLSRMDEEETTRGDDDKKISFDHSYEVLVESFDYTIVAFEPMMSVYFRPHERERREESFYFCI